MLAFLADENFNGDIFRGILRENAQVDLVRAQDVGLSGQTDPEVLRWAAENGRIVLTHDLASMPHFADDRVVQGLEMPGVIAVRRNLPYSSVIEDLLLIEHCMEPAELQGKTTYLPLR
jgi:predicted nuclease of predicted toxin-antitoxin system